MLCFSRNETGNILAFKERKRKNNYLSLLNESLLPSAVLSLFRILELKKMKSKNSGNFRLRNKNYGCIIAEISKTT